MTREVVVVEGNKGARLLLAAVVVLGLILIYAPAVYLLLASLNPGMQLGLVPPDRFSLVWYHELLHDRKLISALTESTIDGLATAAVARGVPLQLGQSSAPHQRADRIADFAAKSLIFVCVCPFGSLMLQRHHVKN